MMVHIHRPMKLNRMTRRRWVSCGCSSSRSQGERRFYTLHLQVENMDDYYKMNSEELSEKDVVLI